MNQNTFKLVPSISNQLNLKGDLWLGEKNKNDPTPNSSVKRICVFEGYVGQASAGTTPSLPSSPDAKPTGSRPAETSQSGGVPPLNSRGVDLSLCVR